MSDQDSAQRPLAVASRTTFGAVELDDVDRRLLSELERDGRISNKELAAAAGIAPSTCHARVRALRESGVLRGFHAQVDPEAVGRGLQAMIAVRLQAAAASSLLEMRTSRSSSLSRRRSTSSSSTAPNVVRLAAARGRWAES